MNVELGVVVPAAVAVAAYLFGVRCFERRRTRRWPRWRTAAFLAGVLAAVLAVDGPLDAASDAYFSWHMVQHLVLTDLSAPLLLFGGPLLLALGALPTAGARRLVRWLRTPLVHALTFPAFTWLVFVVALWGIHYTGLFEAALENETIHAGEHALFLGTALLFWLPIIPNGPTPWSEGPLAYPLRMLYMFLAMPAEGLLGFTIYSASHILYPYYRANGIGDQHTAGEIMWVGGGFVMFLAYMAVGIEWARREKRRDDREVARAVRSRSVLEAFSRAR